MTLSFCQSESLALTAVGGIGDWSVGGVWPLAGEEEAGTPVVALEGGMMVVLPSVAGFAEGVLTATVL